MVAVDTNVLVRFLTRDDPRQAARAAALLRSEQIWLAKSVLLETEWVLRALYGFAPDRVLEALQSLAGLPNVHLEDPPVVAGALEWSRQGLDFADALHLASRGPAQTFATFDESLVRRVRRLGAGFVTRLS